VNADGPEPSPSSKGVPAGPIAGLVFGSCALIAFVGLWEPGKDAGLVYADKLAKSARWPQGIPTVCKGLTPHVTSKPMIVGDHWSPEKCAAEEQRAMVKVQHQLRPCFTRPPTQFLFDAFSSHAWNFGASATCGSGAMRAWNATGDAEFACRRLQLSDDGRPVWSFVTTTHGKVFVPGLANRRESERRFCKTGVPVR
jgi:lysozyme